MYVWCMHMWCVWDVCICEECQCARVKGGHGLFCHSLPSSLETDSLTEPGVGWWPASPSSLPRSLEDKGVLGPAVLRKHSLFINA